MTIWFSSDTHFGHARIIELSNRPFASVEEMNEIMVERWNAVVRPHDTVYHLGDAVMGKFDENVTILSRLNGIRFLVPGNHDRVSSVEKPARRERFRADYENQGFVILDEHMVVTFQGVTFNMSHYPYEGDSHGVDRHVDLRPARDGKPLIHGHVHEEWRINGDQFNVGVDVNDYTPVHIDVLLDWARSLRG